MIVLNDQGPPITDSELDAIEHQLGHSLPGAYRAFLLRNNGGCPDGGVAEFDIPGEGDTSDVRTFYRLSGGIRSSRLLQVLAVMEGRFPKGVIPIATDSLGNKVCIQCSGPGTGRIYFWDHDFETDPPSMENMTLLAETLDDFLEALRLSPYST